MSVLFFFLFILTQPALTDSPPLPQWQNIRNLYDAGKYEEALRVLTENPLPTASYYYNLGNIHYRLGKYGQATAFYEKANRLHPHDPDIQHNLKLSRSTLSQVLGQETLSPSSSWLESMADNIPPDEVRGILGVVAFIVLLFWTRSYLKTKKFKATLLRPSGYLGLIAFFITVSLYAAQRVAQSNPPVICLEEQTVRSGPGDHFLALAKINQGVKLRFVGQSAQGSSDPSETWQQIRYAPDSIGWIRASSLLPL